MNTCKNKIDRYLIRGKIYIDEKCVGILISQWLPCPLAMWSLWLWMTALSTCHMELVSLNDHLVHLPCGACGFGWQPCPLAIWSLWLWMTALSTCHVELVALDGSLVHLPYGACGFGWLPCPLVMWSLWLWMTSLLNMCTQ